SHDSSFPLHPRERVSIAGGRSPGLRVTAPPRLPEAHAPVAFGERLSAHSCGGSRGIGRCWPSPHSLWALAGTDDAFTIAQSSAAATFNRAALTASPRAT